MLRHGRVVWGTASLKRLLGWGPELRGADVLIKSPDPETRARVTEIVDSLQSGETQRLTAPILTSDGETLVAESRFVRRNGRIYHYIVRMFGERRKKPRARRVEKAGGRLG